LCAGIRQPAGVVGQGVVFRVVQRRMMSHTDIGIVGATTDSFILFENGARRNRLVLPGFPAPLLVESTSSERTI
jgi:hypothetical protein